MSLRLRLTLAFLAIVSLMLVVAVTSFFNSRLTQERVAALRSDMGLDLRRVDLESVSLEIEGYWSPNGAFVATKVGVAPGPRRPKLRGAIQELDSGAREIVLFGRTIVVEKDAEFVDAEDAAAGFGGLQAGQRIEVTCRVDEGNWTADKIKTQGVKTKDKIKGTSTRSDLDGVAPETIEISGLVISLPQSGEAAPQSALRHLELATKITQAVTECRTGAYELVGRRIATAELDEVLERDDPSEHSGSERMIAARESFDQYLNLLQTGIAPSLPTPSVMVARWVALLGKHHETLNNHIDALLSLSSEPARAQEYLDDSFSPFLEEELLPLVYAFQAKSEEQLGEQLQDLVTSTTKTTRLATKTSAIAALLAFGLGFLLWRSIHRPLKDLQEAASHLGQGHLDTRVPVRSNDEVGVLAQAFNRMASQLATTTVSMGNLENVFDSIGGALIVCDAEKLITSVNQATLDLLGYERSELVGKHFSLICKEKDPAGAPADAGILSTNETVFQRKDGSAVPVSFTGSELTENGGLPVGFVCMALDLTERKQMEERLRHSLSEKELLLREVHHRVKNNMQVISSLLAMQAGQIEDLETIARFEDSQNRIRSMALIHEQLYQSDDFSEIAMPSYLEMLMSHVLQSHKHDDSILVQLHVDELTFNVDQALSCGLIINELVANAFKHAFPDASSGSIDISLRGHEGGECILEVADNGRGLNDPFDQERSETLGLNLVKTLASQLGGEVAVEGDSGLRISIRFRQQQTPNLLAS